MERPYLNQELRRLVAKRADYLCEYCLISEKDTILGCAIDHIISIKHGGSSNEDLNNPTENTVFSKIPREP